MSSGRTLAAFVRRCELDCVGEPEPDLSRAVDAVTKCEECDGAGFIKVLVPTRVPRQRGEGVEGQPRDQVCWACLGSGRQS